MSLLLDCFSLEINHEMGRLVLETNETNDETNFDEVRGLSN